MSDTNGTFKRHLDRHLTKQGIDGYGPTAGNGIDADS